MTPAKIQAAIAALVAADDLADTLRGFSLECRFWPNIKRGCLCWYCKTRIALKRYRRERAK